MLMGLHYHHKIVKWPIQEISYHQQGASYYFINRVVVQSRQNTSTETMRVVVIWESIIEGWSMRITFSFSQ